MGPRDRRPLLQGRGQHAGRTRASLWSASGAAAADRDVHRRVGARAGRRRCSRARTRWLPGTSYVISYHAPQGHYAATSNDFTVNRTVGPLTTPAVGQRSVPLRRGRRRTDRHVAADELLRRRRLLDGDRRTCPPSRRRHPRRARRASRRPPPWRRRSRSAPASGTPPWRCRDRSGRSRGQRVRPRDATGDVHTGAPPCRRAARSRSRRACPARRCSDGAWTFTTAAATGASVSLWTDAEVPTVAAWNDPDPVMVGTRFTASVAGRRHGHPVLQGRDQHRDAHRQPLGRVGDQGRGGARRRRSPPPAGRRCPWPRRSCSCRDRSTRPPTTRRRAGTR